MTTARLLAALRNNLHLVRLDVFLPRGGPQRAGSSLAVYVDDSARRQDTIAALDDAVRIMANPLEEVRAWLVADLHAMGHASAADKIASDAATVWALNAYAVSMPSEWVAMLSPRTRAALGIGG